MSQSWSVPRWGSNHSYVDLFLHIWFVEGGEGYTPSPWNINFGIWCEVETWTSDSPRQKETINEIVTLVRCIIIDQNRFQTKLRDQVADVTNQPHMLSCILSVNFSFTPCQEVERWKDLIFSLWKLVNKLWGILKSCSLRMNRYFNIISRNFC